MIDTAAVVPAAPPRRWLGFAALTVLLWGVWGAFAGISAQRGSPTAHREAETAKAHRG